MPQNVEGKAVVNDLSFYDLTVALKQSHPHLVFGLFLFALNIAFAPRAFGAVMAACLFFVLVFA